MKRSIIMVLVFLGTGCEAGTADLGGSGEPDAGPPAPQRDGGLNDGAATDAETVDAGTVDAAPADTGPTTTGPYDCVHVDEPAPRPPPPTACGLEVPDIVLASPRGSALAELAARAWSGDIAAPSALYERTRHEVCRMLELAPDLTFVEEASTPGFLLRVDAAALDRIRRDDWPALDCLNDAYGLRVGNTNNRPNPPYFVGMSIDARIRPAYLSTQYAALPGVEQAGAIETLEVAEPSSSICFATRDDGTHAYRIERRLAPCRLQCQRTVIDIFEGSVDGTVRQVLRWDSATMAPYPEAASVPGCDNFVAGGSPGAPRP